MARLDRAVQNTVATLQWPATDLLGSSGNSTGGSSGGGGGRRSSEGRERLQRFKGPDDAALTPEQAQIREEILSTRTTGLSGPFGE